MFTLLQSYKINIQNNKTKQLVICAIKLQKKTHDAFQSLYNYKLKIQYDTSFNSDIFKSLFFAIKTLLSYFNNYF